MTYQVLARKWRPQSFTDMVGQDHISSTLCNAIKNQRVGHAYLFVGTRGTGKTTTARIFAKAINCENPKPDANPCNECVNCKEITAGSSMDVLEIDGASNNGVDDIRRLRDNVQYTPARCKFKVYIIDEVHMLSTAAWNALLKTLEEPPEHVKFLFATTEVHKVLPTILSRCQRFDLKRISQGTIARRLQEIAQQEKANFDSPALNSIARAANGGMRDALSIMDQMIAFCSDQEIISEHDVSEVFGLTSSLDLGKIISALLTDNAEQLISEINRLADVGRNLEQLYSDLLHFCRNLMICSISGEGAKEILDLDEYDFKMAQSIVSQSSADTIQKLMDGFLNYDGKLRNTLNKRVFMEMTLVRIMKDAHAVSLNDILARINHLRKTGSLDALEADVNTTAKVISLPEPQKKNDLAENILVKKPEAPQEVPIIETIEPSIPAEEPVLEADHLAVPEKEETADQASINDESSPSLTISEEKVIEQTENESVPSSVDEQEQIPQAPKQNIPINEGSQTSPKAIKTSPPTFTENKRDIDDSFELPYSTLIDEEYIAKARLDNPLNISRKNFQGTFDENNETPGSTLGLFYTFNSESKLKTETPETVIPDLETDVKTDQEIQTEVQETEETYSIETPDNPDDPSEDETVQQLNPPQEEFVPQQAPISETTAADTHEVIEQSLQKNTSEVSPESKAASFWNLLEANNQSNHLKSLVQHINPVSYQENRFYAAYETGEFELDAEAKNLLEGELRKICNNPSMELRLVGASKEAEDDKPVLSSGEDVWSRVQSNPLFSSICKEFDGKIIDVRG